jgi:hypothetical protein
MTTMDIPLRHLVEETPEGTRWFYPAPAGGGRHYGDPRTIGWEDPDGVGLNLLSTGANRPDWLVASKPLAAVVQVLQEPDVLEGWRRKSLTELAKDDEVAAALITAHGGELSEAFPWQIAVDGKVSSAECGCTDTQICTWHTVFNRAYTPVMTSPDPIRVRHELPDSVPLAGGADPAPGRDWYVPDPVRAYYGGTVVHVLPGYLVSDPKAIGALLEQRLAELGLSNWNVYAFDHRSGGQFASSVSCSGDLRWDRPLELPRAKGRSREAREFNRAQERKAKVAMSYREEAKVPSRIFGTTKAEALEAEARLMAEIVERLIPDHITACSTCHGVGFVD